MADDDSPRFRLVASNSDVELRTHQVRDDIAWPLRDLAANMLRVIRGAGKPEQLARQMVEVLKSFEAYRAEVGAYPSNDDITRRLTLDAIGAENGGHCDEWSLAINAVTRGALQKTASELLGQSTQATRGENELIDGVIKIEAIRDANRRAVSGRRVSPARRGRKPKPIAPK